MNSDVIRRDRIQTLAVVDGDARLAIRRVLLTLEKDFDQINPLDKEFHVDGYFSKEHGWHISIRFVERSTEEE